MGARRWIGFGLAVVVVAAVVVVVAQSGGGGGGPLDAIAKAAEITQREPGGRAVLKATVTVDSTGEGIAERGSMTFDDSGRAEGEFTVRGLTNGKEAKLVSISDGSKGYVSSDAFDSLPAGKTWMEIDFAAAAGGASSADPVSGGPNEGLKLLDRVQESKVVGKEDIRGVPTTHYKGTLPTPDRVFGVKASYSALDVDVWIDAQDRVRRFQIAVSGAVAGSEVSSTTKMTTDFVEFGRVPKIELPPANEVFNATGEIESQIQETAEGG
jgi:uncharacterized protein YfiM (DUF2279 family)